MEEHTVSMVSEGKPVPQGRPRATQRGGFIRMYDPASSQRAKRKLGKDVLRQWGDRAIIEGPVRVCLTFRFKPPKSRIKKTKNGDPVLVKPDLDNLVKLVLDAITDTGRVWKDDNRVAQLSARKIYDTKFQQTDIEISYGEKWNHSCCMVFKQPTGIKYNYMEQEEANED